MSLQRIIAGMDPPNMAKINAAIDTLTGAVSGAALVGPTITGGASVSGGLTVTGGLTVSTGGLTVSASGINVTGSATLNNGATIAGALSHTGSSLGFYNHATTVQNTVSGSRGGIVALQSLMIALNSTGIIVDSTTP